MSPSSCRTSGRPQHRLWGREGCAGPGVSRGAGCRGGFRGSGLCGRGFHVGFSGKAGIAWPCLRGRCLTWQLQVPPDAAGSAAASRRAPTLRRRPGLQVLGAADRYPRAWGPRPCGLSWSQKRGCVGDRVVSLLGTAAWWPGDPGAHLLQPLRPLPARPLCGEGGQEQGRAMTKPRGTHGLTERQTEAWAFSGPWPSQASPTK